MTYIPDDPYQMCPRCGFKKRYSDMRTEWTGKRVCSRCWDPKHPALTPHPVHDEIAMPKATAKPVDRFQTRSVTADDL